MSVVLVGEGDNLNRALAWLDATFGPGGFDWADTLVSEALSTQPGFQTPPTILGGDDMAVA